MARVFVTGSADGLGKMAAELLIEQGHKVVLHARSAARAEETRKKVGGAEHIVVGDLSNIAETKSVAELVNRLGRFDAVIHNAGISYRKPKLVKTVDGLPQLFAVNTLAPYLLTALITMPKWLVYLSSGMHYGAGSHLDDMLWEKRRWNGSQAYAETKFQDVLLAFAVARLFPEVKSNSLEPGWAVLVAGFATEQGHRLAGKGHESRLTGHVRNRLPALGGLDRIARAEGGERKLTILSTGSELHLAVQARDILQKQGVATAVVSMPCRLLFEQQDPAYKKAVLGTTRARVAVEAAVELGWERYIGLEGRFVGMHSFGASGKIADVYKKFDINAEAVVRAAHETLAEVAAL